MKRRNRNKVRLARLQNGREYRPSELDFTNLERTWDSTGLGPESSCPVDDSGVQGIGYPCLPMNKQPHTESTAETDTPPSTGHVPLRTIVEMTLQCTRASFAVLFSAEDRFGRIITDRATDRTVPESLAVMRLVQRLAALCAGAGKMVLIPDAKHDARLRDLGSTDGIRSIIAAPVQAAGRSGGVLAVFSYSGFSDIDTAIVQAVSKLLGESYQILQREFSAPGTADLAAQRRPTPAPAGTRTDQQEKLAAALVRLGSLEPDSRAGDIEASPLRAAEQDLPAAGELSDVGLPTCPPPPMEVVPEAGAEVVPGAGVAAIDETPPAEVAAGNATPAVPAPMMVAEQPKKLESPPAEVAVGDAAPLVPAPMMVAEQPKKLESPPAEVAAGDAAPAVPAPMMVAEQPKKPERASLVAAAGHSAPGQETRQPSAAALLFAQDFKPTEIVSVPARRPEMPELQPLAGEIAPAPVARTIEPESARAPGKRLDASVPAPSNLGVPTTAVHATAKPVVQTPVPAVHGLKPAAGQPVLETAQPASSRAPAQEEKAASKPVVARTPVTVLPKPVERPAVPDVSVPVTVVAKSAASDHLFGPATVLGRLERSEQKKSRSKWVLRLAGVAAVLVLGAAGTWSAYKRLYLQGNTSVAQTQSTPETILIPVTVPPQTLPARSEPGPMSPPNGSGSPAPAAASNPLAPTKPAAGGASREVQPNRTAGNTGPESGAAREKPVVSVAAPARTEPPEDSVKAVEQPVPETPKLPFLPTKPAVLLSYVPKPAPRVDVAAPRTSEAVPAEVISRVLPVYPPAARLLRLQGTVVVRAKITAEGRVSDVQVVSGNPAFRDSALSAVRKWRYKPARLNGQSVETTADVTLRFSVPQ